MIVEGFHTIKTSNGSIASAILDSTAVVNSLHHQAIDDPGPSWRVTARADDGVIEVLEWDEDDGWSALGVQWHPELDNTGTAVFGWLVGAARAGSLSRCD